MTFIALFLSALLACSLLPAVASADATVQSDGVSVSQLFLRWSGDYGGANVFVGPGEQMGQIEIMEKGQLVQLNAYYLDTTGSGVMQEAANGTTQLGVVGISWSSSDVAVATVSPSGLVTPVGNGSCTIRAEVTDPAKFGAASVEVPFVIDGQEGEYVGDVQITYEDGTVVPDGTTIVLESDEDEPVPCQLGAQVTWVDSDGNTVRVEKAVADMGSITAACTWTSEPTEMLYVNELTGRVMSQQSGTAYVALSVAGGVGGAAVTDTVYFSIRTGQYSPDVPAESLTINVSYADDIGDVVATRTYSLDELSSMFTLYGPEPFTMIRASDFATFYATGYRFIDVVGLVNVDMEDIYQFRFGTSDGYDNPVSYDYLFGRTRYYYPNWDIGMTTGAKVSQPILATEASVVYNASYPDPSLPLDSGYRFRLLFGPSSPSDSQSAAQVRNIDTIDVILKGEAMGKYGGGVTIGEGDGTSASEGAGGGAAGAGAAGDSGGSAGDGLGQPGTSASQEASESLLQGDGGASASVEGSGAGESGDDEGEAHKWTVRQVMVSSESMLPVREYENALAPLVGPAACIAAVGGALNSLFGYRRRLFQ